MGQLCCKKKEIFSTEIDSLNEPEIKIPSYSSTYDKELIKLEKNYNLLKNINFMDFMYLLSSFSMNNATINDDFSKAPKHYSRNDPFFSENLSVDYFQTFIDNKIFKHPANYTISGNNETLSSISKEILIEMYKSLLQKINQAYEKIEQQQITELKKYHIICFGFLFCTGLNIKKIKTIFDIFKDPSDNILRKNFEFEDFLMGLCLISSYCLIFARHTVSKKHQEIETIDKNDLSKMINVAELKDTINLVQIIQVKLFGQEYNKGLNDNEWNNMFKDENGIPFILSTKGIRKQLEINNV